MARVTYYMATPDGSVAGGKGGDPAASLAAALLLVTAIGEVEGVSAVSGAPEAVAAAEAGVAVTQAQIGAGITVSFDHDVFTTWNDLAKALRAIIDHTSANFPVPDEE
jgi:3-oxoacyl-ACP reductase-like protein